MSSAKTKCSRLFRNFSDRVFILVDMSYVTLPHSIFNNKNYIFAISTTHPIIKYVTTSTYFYFPLNVKFEDTNLVWNVMNSKYLSPPFNQKSGFVFNRQWYLKEFMRHPYYHWLELHFYLLESSYCKVVLSHFNQQNIEYIDKFHDLYKFPKIRPTKQL